MKKRYLSVATIVALSMTCAVAQDNVQKIGEIVVSATGKEQKIVDAPASISVITAEELQKKQYTNLLDIVEETEGIDFGTYRDEVGQGEVSIRGMGAAYTLVLVDGKKQSSNGDIFPNGFDGAHAAFIPPVSMIERVEIIRGPMSTLYGADAMGGVINIITKKVVNEWTGSFTQSQTFQTDSQFGNDKTTDFAIAGPLIKDVLGLTLRGSYYDKEASNPKAAEGDGATATFGTRTLDNQNWTAGAGLTWTPNERHTIRANYDIGKQKYDNSEGLTGTVATPETAHGGPGYEDYAQAVYAEEFYRYEREQWSLDYETEWDFGTSTISVHNISTRNLGREVPFNVDERRLLEANTAVGGIWHDLDAALADPEFLALADRPNRNMESRTTTFSAKYEMPFEKHYAVIGAEYIDAEFTDDIFVAANKLESGMDTVDSKQFSLFAEDSWTIIDPFTLTFGVRYDDNEGFGGHFSPRAYGVYTLSDNWTLKGGVSTGYKAPNATVSYDGISYFGSQGRAPRFGNPDLEPETSTSYEFAVYYEHDDGHNANITYFRNDFKDKIETQKYSPAEWADIEKNSGIKKWYNVTEATIQGIEFAGKYQILDNLSLRGNYTFVDSENKETGRPLDAAAEHLYNVSLEYDPTDKLNTFLKLSGEANRWRDTDDEALEALSPYYKNYTVIDIGGSYKIADNITFHARVNNLLDKDYSGKIYYTDADGIYTNEINYSLFQKKREFWVSLQVDF